MSTTPSKISRGAYTRMLSESLPAAPRKGRPLVDDEDSFPNYSYQGDESLNKRFREMTSTRTPVSGIKRPMFSPDEDTGDAMDRSTPARGSNEDSESATPYSLNKRFQTGDAVDQSPDMMPESFSSRMRAMSDDDILDRTSDMASSSRTTEPDYFSSTRKSLFGADEATDKRNFDDLLEPLPPLDRPVKIIFPYGTVPINDVFVVDEGIPCRETNFKREATMVTKIFVKPNRRRPNAALEEYNVLMKARREFDPDGLVSNLSRVILTSITPEEDEMMRQRGISLGDLDPKDYARWNMPIVNMPLLLTPKVGTSLYQMMQTGLLMCFAGAVHMARLLIPLVKKLDACHKHSNMYHNDVTTYNICYDSLSDRLYLIDFEMLAPAKSEVQADLVKLFRSVLCDREEGLFGMFSAAQQEYLNKVAALPNEEVNAARLVTILTNLVSIE